jgi:hypothetical protein
MSQWTLDSKDYWVDQSVEIDDGTVELDDEDYEDYGELEERPEPNLVTADVIVTAEKPYEEGGIFSGFVMRFGYIRCVGGYPFGQEHERTQIDQQLRGQVDEGQAYYLPALYHSALGWMLYGAIVTPTGHPETYRNLEEFATRTILTTLVGN